MNFWRGDGEGEPKQESGDFCGWVGEISTPISLLKDRLIGDEGGEEFLEGEKEGISFSSPEIPTEGENFVGAVEGKREISSSPPGGESSDRGEDFLKEFSPTTEGGGSEGGGSSSGKELPEPSGGEGSPHSEAALHRVRVVEAEALRRAKGRTPQAPLIPYFLTAGGQEIVGLLDTGSSHFLMKKEIFEKMEGKEVVAPTSYKGVEGGLVQQQKGKLVKCQTCFGETDYIAYPQLAQLAVEALVPLQIGLAMGLEVKRVPKYWISKLQKSNDRKWVQSVRERLKETKFPKAQREFVLNRIKRALRENSKLPPNTRCNLPNSSFRIELKEGVVASLPISDSRGDDSKGEREVWGVGGESMGGSPSSRREEQLEFPSSGCEQGIRGGCGTGGHSFVYGLQEGKQAHKGAYVYHSFVEGDVGEVGGVKKFFRVRLGECLSPSQP